MKPSRASSLIVAARILTVFYGVILVILAVLPRIEGHGLGAPDFVLHGVAYGLFGGLLWVSGLDRRISGMRLGMAAVGGAALFGLLTEILQFFISYRSFEVADVVADTIGAMVVVLFLVVAFEVLGGRRWVRT